MHSHYIFHFIITVFYLHFNLKVQAQNEWNLQKDKENIKVYTREVVGHDLNEFKAITTLHATVSQLVNTLKDVDNFKTWIPDCEVAEIKERKDNEQIHYLELYAPFPVSNRDSYYRFTYKSQGENVMVKFTALPEYGPEKDGIVRIPQASGFWLFEKINDQQSKITYQAHATPGGSIPGWLANSAVVDNPFETLKNLKKRFSH